MRHKALALFLLFAPATATFAARAQENATSGASSSVWNDNSLIKVQKVGGDPTRYGDVKIEFYGHNAFVITSPTGLTVLTDPWRNDSTGHYPRWFLSEFPAIRVDIVLSTHAHFDHDAVERPNGLVILERLIGEFKLGDDLGRQSPGAGSFSRPSFAKYRRAHPTDRDNSHAGRGGFNRSEISPKGDHSSALFSQWVDDRCFTAGVGRWLGKFPGKASSCGCPSPGWCGFDA
jgi:hypothetical protein